MTSYKELRPILENILSDNNWHNIEEFLQVCSSTGLHLDDRSAIYNIMHQLKKKGVIRADGNGNYQNIKFYDSQIKNSELLSSIKNIESEILKYKNFNWINCSDSELQQARITLKLLIHLSKKIQDVL